MAHKSRWKPFIVNQMAAKIQRIVGAVAMTKNPTHFAT